MNTSIIIAWVCLCWVGTWAQTSSVNSELGSTDLDNPEHVHIRNKRTLFLKKKLIGAGLLGFGLGVAKG